MGLFKDKVRIIYGRNYYLGMVACEVIQHLGGTGRGSKVKVILDYTVCMGPAWATRQLISKQNSKETSTKYLSSA